MVFLPALYNKLQCVADAITRVPATELKVEHSRGKEQRRTRLQTLLVAGKQSVACSQTAFFLVHPALPSLPAFKALH